MQNKADMLEKGCLSISMPFVEKARHVLDLCVSDLFHPFTQNKADMCEKRCLTNSMSLAEKARHVCHWMSDLFYTPEQRFWLIPV